MINVWHIRKAPKDAQYIGRESGGYPRSPFCNPCSMRRFMPSGRPPTREDVLIEFALYWFAPEQKNLRKQAVTDLPDDIMCWCAPLWCHGHIIAGYVEWVRRNEGERALRDYDSFLWPSHLWEE